ncbi:MAG: non-homologous end-joining DNA ligase, partial [Myxococcaceae bacterium]
MPRPRLFVVQKHRATRMHYDFRLEWGGVLRSWAVPKGFSADPKDKHLAIHVEDHPVDYADFEGVIPQGNYGAGAVIVWDRGTWVPLEDPEAGWRKGKLLFSLSGHKLRGVWTLFRIKSKDGADNVWLMMKKPDAGGNTVAGGTYPEHSVLSGLLVEERADAAKRAEKALARLRILGAPQRKVSAKDVQLMLATPADGHFEKKGFWFEPKYDGFRVLLERVDGRVRIRYRHGQDATAIFPEVAAALSVLPFEQFILDAEIVVLDENRKPSFQRLQKRAQLKRPTDVSRAAVENVATCFVFDLLALESFDLRPLALRARKEILESILPALGVLRVTPHFSLPGERVFEHATRLGFEGVVGKRTDSPYRGGRSRDWLKHRALQTGDFAVVGFTEPRGSRSGLGALHLATFDAGRFLYGGAVGTGFTEKALRALRTQLEPDVRATPPCQGAAPKGRGHRWVKPRLVAEVRFVEWTKDGVLRQPAFVRLRDDKLPKECTGERPLLEPPPVPETSSREKRVAFTHLDKLFWPAEGLRKGDLIDYYRSIAPWMLPYLRDRPLVLTRFPDGISGKSFFQKDAPGFAPDWIRLAPIWSESAQRESRHIVADDVETLLYVANSAAIPIHLWA